MQKLLDDYAAIIVAPRLASDRFWALENRLQRDVRHTGVRAEMRRSRMHQNIARLLNEGSITVEDLKDFTDEIKESAASNQKNSQ